jgi:hypothetical protein
MPALEGNETNSSPLPIAATIALEMVGPIARTLIKRSHPTSRRARTSISLDKLPIRSSRRRPVRCQILDEAQHAWRQGIAGRGENAW